MGAAKTILIVDDEALIRTLFTRILERAGFATVRAENGDAGLSQFRANRPDLVLLDLRMPGTDGLDVLRAMVEESPETPVVVVSGAGTLGDAVEALRRGAWDFVVKPMVDPELLAGSVERALEKAELRRQNQQYRANLEQQNRALANALGELRADQQAARVLQFQLLPRDGLSLGGYRGFRRLFPSQLLSGDFVDYFALNERFIALYVADVSGHGAASAFVTAILTTLVGKYREALAADRDDTALDPQALLAHLDHDIEALTLGKHVSMFYGVVDLAAQRLRFANAGLFPFPLICDRDGVRSLECPGRPLGLPGRGRPVAGEIALPRAARLFCATDGVLELGPDGSQRDKGQALRRLLEETSDLDALVSALGLDHADSLRDDVAMLYLCGEETMNRA